MAKAPRPMTESRADKAARDELQQTVIVFRLGGDREYRIAPFNVPIREKLVVQSQSQLRKLGVTWEEAIRPLLSGQISSASMAVIVWVARRLSGEPDLTWDEHADEWDTDALGDVVTVEVETAGEGGDDPEG